MNSRKGVTPIVATVLLITISIAATASAYTFIRGAQQDTIQGFNSELSKEQRQRQSNINAEYVYNSSDGYTIMNLRNTGSISIPITKDSGDRLFSLYADGRPVGSQGKGWTYIGSSIDVLDPSELLTLNTTLEYPSQGDSISLKIVGPYKVTDSHVCYNSGSESC